MQTTCHAWCRCAQSADHFANIRVFPALFSEVVCVLGTSPTCVMACTRLIGGNCTTWGSDTPLTRPRPASCSAKAPRPTVWRAREEHTWDYAAGFVGLEGRHAWNGSASVPVEGFGT